MLPIFTFTLEPASAVPTISGVFLLVGLSTNASGAIGANVSTSTLASTELPPSLPASSVATAVKT